MIPRSTLSLRLVGGGDMIEFPSFLALPPSPPPLTFWKAWYSDYFIYWRNFTDQQLLNSTWLSCRYNAPINSKLQHPPPRAYPGHLTVDRARGGGNLNVALEGWGIWTGLISCSDVIRPWVFFGFCRVWLIYKIEFRLCQWITLSKGSVKEVWRCHYGMYLSKRRVKRLIEDEICLWGEVVQY